METWKPVVGYEGLYEVSNKGGVRDAVTKKVLEFVHRPDRYVTCGLKKNEETKTFAIHRLVAEAFLEKIPGKDIVHHKDHIKSNNNVENLEWCTNADNIKYFYDFKNSNLYGPQKVKMEHWNNHTDNFNVIETIYHYSKDDRYHSNIFYAITIRINGILSERFIGDVHSIKNDMHRFLDGFSCMGDSDIKLIRKCVSDFDPIKKTFLHLDENNSKFDEPNNATSIEKAVEEEKYIKRVSYEKCKLVYQIMKSGIRRSRAISEHAEKFGFSISHTTVCSAIKQLKIDNVLRKRIISDVKGLNV